MDIKRPKRAQNVARIGTTLSASVLGTDIPFDNKLIGEENPCWAICDVKLYQRVRMNWALHANV